MFVRPKTQFKMSDLSNKIYISENWEQKKIVNKF